MSTGTVLIVDDSPLIVDRLSSLLNEIETVKTVLAAGEYVSAIQLLEKHRPGIIILDINLPGKSGIELLRFIKNGFPAIVVVMLSNQADAYYRKICKSMGAAYFVDKSTEFDQIPEIINLISA